MGPEGTALERAQVRATRLRLIKVAGLVQMRVLVRLMQTQTAAFAAALGTYNEVRTYVFSFGR